MRKLPIYLHFMNRELQRSLNCSIDDNYADLLIKVISMMTTERLYTSIAFIWESCDNYTNSTKTLISLYEMGHLFIVSNYNTTDEYLSSSQLLYRHDINRYPMYFTNIPKHLLSLVPNLTKNQNTTNILEKQIINTDNYDSGHPCFNLSTLDRKLILNNIRPINKIVARRANKAITISLFSRFSMRKLPYYPLSRYLSMIHLTHYLETLDADIVTGVPHIGYFDKCAFTYPVNDIEIVFMILDRIGILRQLTSNESVIDDIIVNRCDRYHASIVDMLHFIIYGLSSISDNQGEYKISNYLRQIPRHKIINKLTTILPSNYDSYKKTDNIMLATYRNLEKLVFYLKRKKAFGEFHEYYEGDYKMIKNKVLILTANFTETKTFIDVATQHGYKYNTIYSSDHTIYSFGNIAETEIYLSQSRITGTEAPGAMTLTANDVIDILKPNAVILVGIAFGMKPDTQHIGDILISRQIQLYDPKKVIELDGKDLEYARGDKPQASTRMIDRFEDGKIDWDKCDINFGLIIAGNTLVNSRGFVEKLKLMAPEAIGGEMEGGAIYSVSTKRKVDWIVVKAIADWGYNKTDEHQQIAALNATRYTLHVIMKGGFKN